jgi:CheY-like chemotaxis protein
MVSHELRTPLTPALIAAARLAGSTELPEQARSLAATIRRNNEIEAHLIDDLLDIARVGRGGIELRRETVDVHRTIRDALDICAPTANARHVAVQVALDARTHHADADEARLRQVFWNLLTNAIKFTEPGGSILARTTNTADDLLRVTIRDSGSGMDAATLAGLFSPFDADERMRTEDSRKGLGLGLMICKAIVDAHGGHIWAMSDGPGRGSIFETELPVFRTMAANVTESDAPGDLQTIPDRRLRVLVIEDDVDTGAMLEHFLRHQDCEVEVAPRLDAALRRLGDGWDVVVSDIGLPDGSGLEIARHARGLVRRARLIALSGFGAPADVNASRDAGFDVHLVKPLDFDEFLEAVRGTSHTRSAGPERGG